MSLVEPRAAPATAPPQPPEPAVRGESAYDRLTSMLMAVVIGALLVFGWLSLVYATADAYQSRVTAPLEIIEVFGGGGGTPEGQEGGIESMDVPGAPAADAASNNEVEASDFEAPSVLMTPATMIDAVASGEALAGVDLAPAMPHGGAVASGKRASKIGNGAPAYGFGPGDGGVRREDRWSILYNPGQTPDEYARQLDFFGVELATVRGDQLVYASRFSQDRPAVRTGSGRGDERLYFLWQTGARKASDVALLKKAGIDVGDSPILQFYPKAAEDRLARLEQSYKGRQPAEIRKTRFTVVPRGNGYDFEVLAQEALR